MGNVYDWCDFGMEMIWFDVLVFWVCVDLVN